MLTKKIGVVGGGSWFVKIAYASTWDPISPTSWSGCSLFLSQALAALPGVEVEYLTPDKDDHSLDLASRAKALFYRFAGKNYLPDIDPVRLKRIGAQLSEALSKSDADFVLALDAMPVAYLSTDKPILYYWDCTWLGNLQYPWFANLAAESIRHGHDMEQRALDKCQLAIYSSTWACDTACDGYRVDKSKLRIVPLGANVSSSLTEDDIRKDAESRSASVCKLLFIGVDWRRKGGDLAFDVALELNRRGLPTTLTVAGCAPQISGHAPDFLRPVGFVNKLRDPASFAKLFQDADFVLLPSIAEASACVLCEASSFGKPSLARNVGGMAGTVANGVNGYLFDKDASPGEWADCILDLFQDRARYRDLCISSFVEFRTRLNWNTSAAKIVELYKEWRSDAGTAEQRAPAASVEL